ncbi:hypothetical protein B0H12DRAFT_737516 [Mycena haematopus]|nr:hypothetical protein B0H12DRAFT_737516 [Mycena haematopus]
MVFPACLRKRSKTPIVLVDLASVRRGMTFSALVHSQANGRASTSASPRPTETLHIEFIMVKHIPLAQRFELRLLQKVLGLTFTPSAKAKFHKHRRFLYPRFGRSRPPWPLIDSEAFRYRKPTLQLPSPVPLGCRRMECSLTALNIGTRRPQRRNVPKLSFASGRMHTGSTQLKSIESGRPPLRHHLYLIAADVYTRRLV